MTAASTTSLAAPRARLGVAPLLALGVTLARRGPMAVVSLAVSALTVVVMSLLALSFARRADDAPLDDVPLLASSALAWGGGFLHAFSASVTALRSDRTSGIQHLFVSRTTSLRGYLLARVGGLSALLALVVAGGTLVVGVVSVLAASRMPAAAAAAQATLAGIVYGLGFAAVVAPIAFAALGARSRSTGYFFLLAILVLPELLTSALGDVLPSEVAELCALPSALAALRASISAETVDVLRFGRALVALAVFAALALLVVRRDVVLLEREGT